MFLLKQSTAADIKLGPYVDKGDGVAYETGMAAAMDHSTTGVRLSKNGAAFADRHEGTEPSYDAFGYYLVKLDTTDTDTVGRLKVIFGDAAVCLPCEANFQVLEEAIYDALFAASAAGFDANQRVNVGQWLSQAVTLSTGNKPDVNVDEISDDATAATNLESACDNYSATRGLAGTALPAAAADAAGGLPISDAGGLDLDTKLANTNEVTAARLSELAAGTAGKMANDVTEILTDTGTTLDGRIPAALTANGNIKASLVEILTTALTETAGLLAASFKKFFNVAAPTATCLSLPDAVPGANGGLPTTNGTKVSQTVDLTAGQTIAATVAALGAPVGASISADIAAVKAQTAAIETDTQDLQTQVGTDGAGLTALGDTRIANLDATVSSRLAPAGTLATVTNLTNAPTNGDLTATMKASVTTAVPTAAAVAAAVGVGQPASESYAAAGALPSRDQAMLAILQLLSERSIASTTMTVKKLDGSTTAMTFTLDDATAPTEITRAT
jgi:hypothetical protein